MPSAGFSVFSAAGCAGTSGFFNASSNLSALTPHTVPLADSRIAAAVVKGLSPIKRNLILLTGILSFAAGSLARTSRRSVSPVKFCGADGSSFSASGEISRRGSGKISRYTLPVLGSLPSAVNFQFSRFMEKGSSSGATARHLYG